MRLLKSKSLLKYVISIGLLVFMLAHMDVGSLIGKSASLNWGLLVLSLLLVILQILFLNLRWHSYLNAGHHKVSFSISSLINIAGYLANILFITSIGGIVAKSGLAVRQGLSLIRSVFITFLDRFMTLASLIVFSAVGLPLLKDVIDHKLLVMLVLSVSGVIFIVAVSLIILRSGLLKEFILSSRKRSRIVVVLRSYTEDYGLMFKTSIYSLIAQGCFILGVYVLSLGIEGSSDIPAIEFLALMPVLALISSLPISFGGWGVREGAFVYGLGLIGFSMESAFFLSVQVGFITLVAPFVVGLPYLLKSDMRKFLLSGGKIPNSDD